jgi:hypothetical protein
MRSEELYRWLHECQLDPGHEYYSGWSESREFLIELAESYDSFEFGVSGTFMLTTPPPSSEIPMPIVTATSKLFRVSFVENWLMEPYFTVSIHRQFAGPLVLCGFVGKIEADQPWLLRDLPKQLTYGPVSDDALQFTGAVQNRHMLFALFRILEFNEALRGRRL